MPTSDVSTFGCCVEGGASVTEAFRATMVEMTGRRPGGGSRLAAAAAACAVWAASACSPPSEDAAPSTGPDEPLAEHLARAVEIASEDWPAPWILQLAASRYLFDADDIVLDDHAYVLVTDDGSAGYYLVRFEADGGVSTGPVAGRSQVGLEAFDFGENTITSVEAVDLARKLLGADIAERCGSPRWLDVRGTRAHSGDQSWAVEFSTRGENHTVWIDTRTGTVTEVEEEPC